MDVMYLGAMALLLAAMAGLVVGCERLMQKGKARP